MNGTERYTGGNAILRRVQAVTDELSALESELLRASREPRMRDSLLDDQSGIRLVGRLKVSVDNMRRFLWNYIEACSELTHKSFDYALQSARLDRVTELLQVLKDDAHPGTGPRCILDVVDKVLDVEAAPQTAPETAFTGTPVPNGAGVILRTPEGDWVGAVRMLGERGLLLTSPRLLHQGQVLDVVLHDAQGGSRCPLELVVRYRAGDSYGAEFCGDQDERNLVLPEICRRYAAETTHSA